MEFDRVMAKNGLDRTGKRIEWALSFLLLMVGGLAASVLLSFISFPNSVFLLIASRLFFITTFLMVALIGTLAIWRALLSSVE